MKARQILRGPSSSNEASSSPKPIRSLKLRRTEPEANSLSVRLATTIAAVEELRPIWQCWNSGLDTDIDHYLHSLSNDPTILGPWVMIVLSGRITQALLIGQVRRRRASAVVSFVRIRGPRAKVLEILNGGRLGPPSSAIDRHLVVELLKIIKRGAVDLACFYRLPLGSSLFRHIQELPSTLISDRVPYLFSYSRLELAGAEGRLLPGKTLREARRKMRILERAFPGKTSFQCFSTRGEMDSAIRDAMTVAGNSWQYRLDEELPRADQMHRRLKFFEDQQWLRIYLLYVNATPVAYLIGCLYKETFFCRYAGYDPHFAQFSVGSLLTARAFEELAAAGVKNVDLGVGRDEHNRRLGSQRCEEGTIHVYSPTLRGICVNLFFAVTQLIRMLGRSISSALHLDPISKFWRGFLIGCTKEPANKAAYDGSRPGHWSC
jgi:hypothetical protein